MCCLYEKEVFLRGLRCARYDMDDGTWLIINRDNFDLYFDREPMHSTVLLLNIKTVEYFVKVFGRTIEYGFLEGGTGAVGAKLDGVFNDTTACCGLRDDGPDVSPFRRSRSEKCEFLFAATDEYGAQARCGECRKVEANGAPLVDDPLGVKDEEAGSELGLKVEVKMELENEVFEAEQSGDDFDLIDEVDKDLEEIILPKNEESSVNEIENKKTVRKRAKRVTKNKVQKLEEAKDNVKKEFQCTECNKSFDHVNSLRSHKRIHAKHPIDSVVKCFACGETFSKSIELAKHMRQKHSGIKPVHECSYCKNRFTSLCVLREHLVVHTKEKKYQCTICGKRFTQGSSMNTHRIMVHEGGGKNLMCSLCPTLCHTPSALERHMRVHTNEKPFLCNICGMKFKRNFDLKMHTLYHHSTVRDFSCHVCQKKFITNSSVKRHLLKVHKTKE